MASGWGLARARNSIKIPKDLFGGSPIYRGFTVLTPKTCSPDYLKAHFG